MIDTMCSLAHTVYVPHMGPSQPMSEWENWLVTVLLVVVYSGGAILAFQSIRNYVKRVHERWLTMNSLEYQRQKFSPWFTGQNDIQICVRGPRKNHLRDVICRVGRERGYIFWGQWDAHGYRYLDFRRADWVERTGQPALPHTEAPGT